MPEPAAPAGRAPPPRRRWLWWVLAALALATVFVASANLYLVSITRDAIVADPAAAPERPAVIVLGNLVLPSGAPASELRNRLETARVLYATGKARKIIVSGVVRADYQEPKPMADWLVAHGVPADDVVLDPGGHRTAATMADVAAMGVRSALVSTQAYHLPRSLYLARKAGIDAVGVVAPFGVGWRLMPFRIHLREALARAEILVEVALRGVRG